MWIAISTVAASGRYGLRVREAHVVGRPAPQFAVQREVVRGDDADAGLQQWRRAMRSV
jgi:hypothetical protein